MSIRASAEALGKGIARNGRKSGIWGLAAWASVVLLGCASLGGVTTESAPEVKQKAAMERAKARWQAVMDGNVERAYEFLSAGSKASASLAIYGGRARLKGFRSVVVPSAACETETCKVRVNVVLDHRLMKGIPFDMDENWVLENGQYWYVWRP